MDPTSCAYYVGVRCVTLARDGLTKHAPLPLEVSVRWWWPYMRDPTLHIIDIRRGVTMLPIHAVTPVLLSRCLQCRLLLSRRRLGRERELTVAFRFPWLRDRCGFTASSDCAISVLAVVPQDSKSRAPSRDNSTNSAALKLGILSDLRAPFLFRPLHPFGSPHAVHQ